MSPEGNPKNIGELVERNGKASPPTTTHLQAFALVITAEPDHAVNQPNEFVVRENLVRETTKGRSEAVEAHYQVFLPSTQVPSCRPKRRVSRRREMRI